MQLRTTAAGLVALLATLGCLAAPESERYLVAPIESVAPFERTDFGGPLDVLLSPDFSVPTHLRPCCAFGTGLEVSVASLPLPGFALQNSVAPDAIGRHAYNGGLVSAKHGVRRGFVSGEANGLVYTCRGGFVDLAHLRDYADWTAYLAVRLEALLDVGAALELPEEGGRRFVFVTAFEPDVIDRIGRRTLAVQLARWLAFQLSLWHETATWYGWSALPMFPEGASAFSPEDLYSNALGIHLGGTLAMAGETASEERFNAAMDTAIAGVLEALGAMSPQATERALAAVDGSWWSCKARLPAKDVVLRRRFDAGPELAPWRVPAELAADPAIAADRRVCAPLPQEPFVVGYPLGAGGVSFDRVARLDVYLDESLARSIELDRPASRWLSQRDFPGLLRAVREESRRVFGADHDRPSAVERNP